MKRFKEGEIFHNVIRAFPKVKFLANNGLVRFDRQNYPAAASNIPIQSVALFDLINKQYAGPSSVIGPTVDGAILAETGDFLVTEAGDNLIIES